MFRTSFPAFGSVLEVTMWDTVAPARFAEAADAAGAYLRWFDRRFSRFRADSLVAAMGASAGIFDVGEDMVAMLRMYEALYDATGGRFTPMVGDALAAAGYDATYALVATRPVRPVRDLRAALTIEDDTHVTLHEPVLLDLGALGKGYAVDRVFEIFMRAGFEQVLVNGSGDVRYGGSAAATCGLEDPDDPTKVIGTIALMHGALCASAANRRAWRGRTHFLDPHTGRSPVGIRASWVQASEAALADALATALFLVAPDALAAFSFEYALMNDARAIKRSAGFDADLFTAS